MNLSKVSASAENGWELVDGLHSMEELLEQ